MAAFRRGAARLVKSVQDCCYGDVFLVGILAHYALSFLPSCGTYFLPFRSVLFPRGRFQRVFFSPPPENEIV